MYLQLKKRALLNAIKKGRLPSEYQEVEYLQSTGTQYIDLGIKPSGQTKIECTASGLWTTTEVAPFGTRENSNEPVKNFILFAERVD